MAGKLLPSAGFRELICDPFRGRMRCYSEPYDLSSAMPHDQQAIEQTERDCGNDEQIYRGDAVGMIAEERRPPLVRRTSSPGHVFATLVCPIHGSVTLPIGGGDAHLADQSANFQRNWWLAIPRSRLPRQYTR